MSPSMRILTLSRPLTLIACMVVFMLDPAITRPGLALYALSAAFFLASSAILVGWIALEYKWQVWTTWAEIPLMAYLNWYGLVHYGNYATIAAFMVSAASIPLGLQRRHWPPALAALFVAWLASSLVGMRIDADRWLDSIFLTVLIFLGAMLFFASTGVLMANLKEEKARSEALLKQVTESQAALALAHRQLQESAARQQELAVLEERQRIGREVHDSVAHVLTALVVQTQVARRLLTREPERAAEAVSRCEEMARQALQETRRAVRALHPSGLEQVDDVAALQRLARDYGAATGMEVTVQADEGARSLPPDPNRVEQLYRVFQEALTNAHRHGQATAARAALSATPAELTLEISNNGAPPAHLEPGVGLKSMTERVRSLGGTIALRPGPVGLTIQITVPIKQEVAG